MIFVVLILLVAKLSHTHSCPTFCQCYSDFDGYYVTCHNARLHVIPYNLIKFIQTTEHQNIIVDLTSNFLSILSCEFLEIKNIIKLILTRNQIQFIPQCFSRSSIEILILNENQINFNQTIIISSSKLHYLDISNNNISHLPRTFFLHLRRLRTLILTGEHNLFQNTNDLWLRSITTRNQLTIIVCDENFHLPLCLFDNLFQTNKLNSIELNRHVYCDCSFVYLPKNKINFHICSSQKQQDIRCNIETSRFGNGKSLINLENEKYRSMCLKEYEICQKLQINKTHQYPTTSYDTDLKTNSIELISSITSSFKHQFLTTSSTTITAPRKENIPAGAIISFVLIFIIVTIVCLYIILSGQVVKRKIHKNINNFKNEQNKQQAISNTNIETNLKQMNGFIPNENLNMNSNRQPIIIDRYLQQQNSYSDDDSELTFYTINNYDSSTSFRQSSMTEFELTSLTSTINSSLSNETVIISNRKQQNMY